MYIYYDCMPIYILYIICIPLVYMYIHYMSFPPVSVVMAQTSVKCSFCNDSLTPGANNGMRLFVTRRLLCNDFRKIGANFVQALVRSIALRAITNFVLIIYNVSVYTDNVSTLITSARLWHWSWYELTVICHRSCGGQVADIEGAQKMWTPDVSAGCWRSKCSLGSLEKNGNI